jgi:nucleoside-diphosphate-sugar epimerase
MQVLIIGCGYVGMALASQLLRMGHVVFGLRRSPTSAEMLPGLKWLTGDVTRADTLRLIPQAFDWVVYCVSSSHGTASDYQAVYLEGTRNVLHWLAAAPPRKFVYTSSTGVYAQNDGSIVDESSATIPLNDTSRILLATESTLLNNAQAKTIPAVILRVAGIYGPGRGYWLRTFLKGAAEFEATGERWLNMIHRDDVAGAISAALEQGTPGQIYNASDSEPAQLLTVFQWLAATLERPMPRLVAEPADSPAKRGVTNKRISNRKLRETCGWNPRYPTFREGYLHEIAGMT